MKIKDILTIDLSEDIKNVIDLEDISEEAIKSEIESYIVTDGLAKEYSDFVTTYTSNVLETGVWLSGFYGSGKSYFGKLLGYMLSNRSIVGTPARERILQRFTGIQDEALIRNSINKIDSVKAKVVALDIAKQDPSKGLAYTLFRNFLKTLELPENEHGFLLFQLMINDNVVNIDDFIFQKSGKNWSDIKNRLVEYAKAAKNIYISLGNSESDYETIISTIRRDIDQFSASRLKDELSNYLQLDNSERIVFMFDETSEAINQDKFDLLDLEGISEALSSLSKNVWTIAIAQEKLDDIINSSNYSKSQLTKVTDRFKTKIHLEATEVDVIIRNRLLKKNESGITKLKENYKANSGKIADHASLIGSGIVKTDSEDNYITYYPFYKYQFDLLQNFLFGTKGYASTKVAARGMIITTYDILKREIQDETLFDVATGWQIARQGNNKPSTSLVNRYVNAERTLNEEGFTISGRKLLETINFLSEAEVVPTTLPNIIKSFIAEPEEFHKMQDTINKAVESLVTAKVLLDTNNTYRITSDIEQRLLEEMNGYTVQGFVKKKQVVTAYKAANFIKSTGRVTDSNLQYDFFISTDNEDELTSPSLKYLKTKVKSVYNISDDREADIDTLKVQHQNDLDVVWVVPSNTNFKELDRLIDEVERITYLEQKYRDPNSDEGKILVSFTTAKSEKQNRINDLVENSLINGTAIYHFNTFQLDSTNWQTILQTQQRNIIQNVYNKRLLSQLSDSVAGVVIKEANNARLQQYFPGVDFKFFDTSGNFIGENLKVVEEILYKIRNTFVDGATLEKDLEIPPTGFTLGTVISTTAALMRAGKIMAKFNGQDKFSWRDEGVANMFATTREFRRASFKAISKSLSIAQKQELAQFLLDIEVEKYIGKKIDYNTNDFELVNAVRDTAKHFVDKVANIRSIEKDFDKLFPLLEAQREYLGGFTAAISEVNYIDKAVDFLNAKTEYHNALESILKVEKFITTSLPRAKEWRGFVEAVNDELSKAAKQIDTIVNLSKEFNDLYSSDIVKNYAVLQQKAQKVKDEYHKLFSEAMATTSEKYTAIKGEVENLIEEINNLPAGLNDVATSKATMLLQYASQRTQPTVNLIWDVKDTTSRFTYSEVLSFIELSGSKKTDIAIIRAGLIKTVPPVPVPGGSTPPVTKTFTSQLPGKKIKVKEYKNWLQQELQKLASAADNDDIEINE
jgi:hypothetical protein